MGDSTRKIDVQKLIAFGNDLVGCLKEEKDVKNLTQHMELSKALQSHCNGDSKAVHNLRQGPASVTAFTQKPLSFFIRFVKCLCFLT